MQFFNTTLDNYCCALCWLFNHIELSNFSSVKQARRVSFAEVSTSQQVTTTTEDEDYDEEEDKESYVPEVVVTKREERKSELEEEESEYISETDEEGQSSDIKEPVMQLYLCVFSNQKRFVQESMINLIVRSRYCLTIIQVWK